MRVFHLGALLVLAPSLFTFGCANSAPQPSPDKEAKIKAALDQLDPAERKLAEEQKYCPVQTDSRLGSMGKPVKVVIEGQTVLLCCEHCEKEARKDAEKTLAQVKELKAANGAARLKKD